MFVVVGRIDFLHSVVCLLFGWVRGEEKDLDLVRNAIFTEWFALTRLTINLLFILDNFCISISTYKRYLSCFIAGVCVSESARFAEQDSYLPTLRVWGCGKITFAVVEVHYKKMGSISIY